MDKIEFQLTPLEIAVLDRMLNKDGELFEVLRQQIACAVIYSRKFTGVGFFTNFTIPSNVDVRRDLPSQEIRGVGAEIEGLRYGAGFLLFVRDGTASCLEGFTYDDPWWHLTARFTLYDIPDHNTHS